MKKKLLLVIAIAIGVCILMTGCNRQIVDTTLAFDKAIISLPNGEIVEGKVTSWKDYAHGDQIQVKINGKTYLVHSSNIALINE